MTKATAVLASEDSRSQASPSTLIGRLAEVFRQDPSREALRVPQRGARPEQRYTLGEIWTLAARLALALDRQGLRPGDNVLFLSENGPRWLATDLALLGLGTPSVPRGVDTPIDEVQYLVEKVSAQFAVVEKGSLLERLPEPSTGARKVIVLEAMSDEQRVAATERGRTVFRFEEFVETVELQDARSFFDDSIAERQPDEPASLVFTSGTSGRPKGVVLRQSNLASNLEQVLSVIGFLDGSRTFLSVLPPWHMFERMVEYALLSLGLEVVYTDRRHFAQDLARERPHVLAAVPRVWVALKDGVEAGIARAPRARQWLARSAIQTRLWHRQGIRWWRDEEPRFGPSTTAARLSRGLRGLLELALWPLDRLAELVVTRPIAQRAGLIGLGEGAGISGGGANPDHVGRFLEALGVRLLEGYGLTETSPVLCVRLPHRNVLRTVGPAVPHTEMEARDPETGQRTSDGLQGVIHVRGPQVMRAYYDDSEATKRALDAEGWFDTGDLGRRTLQGEWSITGRAKDTIVLLSGENVEPEPLENALLESPWIEQAIVVGQDQKFLGALIVPTELSLHQKQQKAGDWREEFRREIDARVHPRRGFRAHERIVRFELLEQPFRTEDGTISPTLKLKRNVIQERFAARIEGLFSERRH